VVALTRDLHVIASSDAARFSAVLPFIGYIAKAWDVGALLHLWIRHLQFLRFEFGNS
jgi:hypothetical protein